MSQLDRAQKPLFQVYSLANLFLALGMLLVALKWKPDSRFWNRAFWLGIAVFLAGWLGFAGLNYWWGTFMMHGEGG